VAYTEDGGKRNSVQNLNAYITEGTK